MGAHPYPFPRVIHNPSIKGTGSWPHCCHHMREEDPERGNSIFFFGWKRSPKGDDDQHNKLEIQTEAEMFFHNPSLSLLPPWFHLSQYRRRDDPRMNGVSPPLCFRPFIAVFVKRINGRKLSLLKVCTPRQPLDRRT